VDYSYFNLREPAKDDVFLEYKGSSNTLSIGVEFSLEYLADEQRRGNGGNALKIYSLSENAN
jgi:hypothetical protein